MAARTKKKKYSPEEFLALEAKAAFRSEYWNGEIISMAGGTGNHNLITLNIAGEIKAKIRGLCGIFAIDVKVWIDVWNSYVYPDVFVVCGESQFYKERRDIFSNPTVIFEVLSEGTKAFDKGDKFLAYQTLESLKEYVLVDQDKYLVEQFIKQRDGNWIYRATIGRESEVYLFSVEQTLKLESIYDLVEFEEDHG